MPNKWIWLAVEGLHNEQDVLGAYASKDKAIKFLNAYNSAKGVKLEWRNENNGDFFAKSHGYDYYVRQCLFNDGE